VEGKLDLEGQQKMLWQQLQLLKLLREDVKAFNKNHRQSIGTNGRLIVPE